MWWLILAITICIGIFGRLFAVGIDKYFLAPYKKNIAKRKFDNFIKSENYTLLTNFSKKYSLNKFTENLRINFPNCDLHNSVFRSYSKKLGFLYIEYPSKINKLRELLETKGHNYNNRELALMILLEMEKLQTHDFQQTFYSVNLETFDDYAKILLNAYGDKWRDYTDLFVKFLTQKGIKITLLDVLIKVTQIEQKLELDAFENQLNHGTDGGVSLKGTQISSRPPIPSKVKREVWRRDNGQCIQCASNESLEYDHIIPVSKGGANTIRNIQLLCEKCNRVKSNKIK